MATSEGSEDTTKKVSLIPIPSLQSRGHSWLTIFKICRLRYGQSKGAASSWPGYAYRHDHCALSDREGYVSSNQVLIIQGRWDYSPRPEALGGRGKARHAGVVGRPMALPQCPGWAVSLPEWALWDQITRRGVSWALRGSLAQVIEYRAGQAGQKNRLLQILGLETDAAGRGRRESRVEAGSSVRPGAQGWAKFGVQEEQTRSETRCIEAAKFVWPAVLGLGDSERIVQCSTWTRWGRVPDRRVRTH